MSDYFGQSPDGYQKPLYAASNFSDVVDKPAALVNLGAASADDVLKAANPIGTIIAFYGSVAPYGYLPCSGQSISSSTFPSLVTFLGGTTSATLPDLRGEFLRGWDNGRGVDLARSIRTAQTDSLKNHFHYLPTESGAGSIFDPAGINPTVVLKDTAADWSLRVAGDNNGLATPSGTPRTYSQSADLETRPRNISVLYCIKAYDCPVNTALLNVATLASEMALKTALTDFTGTNQGLTGNGWQKLPGGFIIQWGTSSTNASGLAAVTLPIAFPNTFATFCPSAVVAGIGLVSIGWTSSNLASASIFLSNSNTGAAINSFQVRWIAIGY